ncbi:Gfo/Idh/MocA family protein [Lolliginicoccus levis]|uniref:Gfo/Idh/MocA family protein n=1 Tax=Lolliginicoccus levis TaxID=2919542 RepID=UPI00241F25E7|nr:Gfo/Idh/MocA family oxidoreductase [Lolliginicoccus levis]
MRVGLVGAGQWALMTHAPALAVHPGVDLVGVWARDPAAAAQVGAPVFDDLGDLVEASDAVAFAVPPAVQAELAMFAVARGKHVILEKPVAGSVADGLALERLAWERGVRAVVFLTRRFAPETRDFLDAAAGREWASADAEWLSGALLGGPFATSSWRQRGGALVDVGPHVLDLLIEVLGPVTDVLCARRDRLSDATKVMLEHAGQRVSTATLSMRTPVLPSRLRVSAQGPSGVVELTSRETPALECYRTMLDEFLDRSASPGMAVGSLHRGVELLEAVARIEQAMRVEQLARESLR